MVKTWLQKVISPRAVWLVKVSISIYIYIQLDGYPASLGFPIMHQVHAICTQSIIAIT